MLFSFKSDLALIFAYHSFLSIPTLSSLLKRKIAKTVILGYVNFMLFYINFTEDCGMV